MDLINGDLAGILLSKGNLIDSAAIAFVVSEMGAIVTTFEGKSWLPFSDLKNMKISPLIIAHNQDIYQEIIKYLPEKYTVAMNN
jgi:fructose-1,6-bisphosphatase/inositol monophosphatase family enzyme